MRDTDHRGDNMDFMTAVKSCFSNYITFRGRASRAEFWYFFLFLVLGSMVTILLDGAVFPTQMLSPLNSIFGLVTVLPWLAVSVRRLHDADRSGWWTMLAFIPLLGIIVLIVWYCTAGDRGDNRYGADPLSEAVPA